MQTIDNKKLRNIHGKEIDLSKPIQEIEKKTVPLESLFILSQSIVEIWKLRRLWMSRFNDLHAYYYFSRRIPFVIRCLELEVDQWERMTKKREIIKIIFAFARGYLENRKSYRDKRESFWKRKRYPNYTFIENRSKSWNKFRSSFCRSIFKVLNVLIFSRLESLVAWIIRIIIFTCLKSRLGASRSLIHHVIIHNIIASSRAAWN